jgi:hypothetical protein
MPKYARILLSGFESASYKLNSRPIIIPENKMIVKKITLYHKHDIQIKDQKNLILTGMADINQSFYSGDAFPKIVGYAEFQDEGSTNESGEYIAEGTAIGKFIDNQFFTDKFGREVQPINEIINFPCDPAYELKREFKDINYSISGSYQQKDFQLIEGQVEKFQITPPICNRYKIYTGVFSGTSIIEDNFYFPDELKVRFNKTINYSVTGTQPWSQNHLVVLDSTPSGGGIPGINVLQKVLAEGSGFVYIKETGLITGEFFNIGLPRTGISGKCKITGYVTGILGFDDEGIFIFNDIVTGERFGETIQLNATGYKNAYNYLIYNNPNILDSIIIEDKTSDTLNTITFSNEEGFNPPTYFSNIQVLNNIINSGSGYGVTSKIINGDTLYLESTISGESGNLIRVTSIGSQTKPYLLNGEYLVSGMSHYPILTPTGDYTGLFSGETKITGYMVIPYEDFISGNINTILGYRTFNDENPIWSVRVSEDNVGFINLINPKYKEFNKYKFTGDFVDDATTNNYNIFISYNNQGNIDNDDTVELKLKINNNEAYTGIFIKRL